MLDAHISAKNFRALMEAMARPGSRHIMTSPGQLPSELSGAMAACLLVLCDQDVAVHLADPFDQKEIQDWILFHCGSRLVAAHEADFAIGTIDNLHPLADFPKGDPQYPDRSATIIIAQEDGWDEFEIRGPGIANTTQIALPDAEIFIENRQLFPLGNDFIFTRENSVTALPRSSMIGGA